MLNKNLSLYKNGLNEMLRPSNYRLVAEIQFSLSIPTCGIKLTLGWDKLERGGAVEMDGIVSRIKPNT